MPDDLQTANVIFCLFRVSNPFEEIVNFMQETMAIAPHGIQAAVVIFLDT